MNLPRQPINQSPSPQNEGSTVTLLDVTVLGDTNHLKNTITKDIKNENDEKKS